MQPLILIIFFLNVQSSYVQNVERPNEGQPDTIQFLLADGKAWRIKTYAIDRDVHVWSIGTLGDEEFEQLAESNTTKHYSDALSRKVVIRGTDTFQSLVPELQQQGLVPNLEISPKRDFAFWVSELNVYSTKSAPP